MPLPQLKWVASPNYNDRHGVRVDQIIIHDMEGSYAGSIAYFRMAQSQVSAHFCVRGDGGEVTQMVHLSDRAWHACAANSRSVGIEMEGYAKNGYKPELLLATTRITAFLCHYLQIPVRHARAGVGPGIESHWGLGPSGGGHSDPSTDTRWMETFVAAVQAEYDRGDFPASWEPDASPAPCRLNPPVEKPALAGLDLSTVAGVQQALNALGGKLEVNGVGDWNTTQAIKSFQMHVGLVADGVAGPLTRAAITNELSGI